MKIKKTTLSGLILISTWLSSCNDAIIDTTSKNDKSEAASLTINSIELKLHQNSVGSNADWLVQIASPEEQFEFWQLKLNHTIQNYDWTIKQEDILNDLLINMRIEWFSTNRSSFEAFDSDWMNRALKVFDIDDLYLISAYPAPFLSENERNYDGILTGGWTMGGGGHHEALCACSQDSDYCDSWLGTGNEKSCTPDCDVDSGWGCGTLLLYKCDGSCHY